MKLGYTCIWVGADSKAEYFGQMVKDFNTAQAGKYEIVVEDQTDYDSYRTKIRTLISTGSAPDLFTVGDYADMEMYSQSGKLMDLTGFLAEPDMQGRFQEGTLDIAYIDGKAHAMPYETALIPIMYNGRLLEQVGAEVPESFEELWAVCESLEGAGLFGTAQMTGKNAWSSMLWYSYALAACGGPGICEKGLDDPAFVQAAELLKMMFDHTSSDAIGADPNVPNGHFFNDRMGIYSNGTWILGRIRSEGVEGLYDNLIVGPGWSYEGKNGGSVISAVQAYMAAGKQDDPVKEEGVKEFFRHITEPERVIGLTNSSGAIFTVEVDTAAIEDPVLAQIIDLNGSAAFQADQFQSAMPVAVANALPAAIEALVLGDVDAQGFVEMLKAAEE